MLNWLLKPSIEDLNTFIDLGTANTVIVVKNAGIVLNEPSVIAVQDLGPQKTKVLKAGQEALNLMKKNPGNIYIQHPLKDGVVADIKYSEEMLKFFFSSPAVKKHLFSPKAMIVVPYEASEVERQGTVQIGKAAGIKYIVLIDEPLVGALGAGIPISSPQGNLIVDIGGGTIEVSVIALNNIIYCESLRLGGHRMIEAIINYYKTERNLLLSKEDAEIIKRNYAVAVPRKDPKPFTLHGINAKTGVSTTLESNSEELSLTLHSFFDQIAKAIFRALNETPPELVSDIMEKGITLIGGGALMPEIATRIQNDTQIKAQVAPNPLLCMAKGGEMILNNIKLLDDFYKEEYS